MNAYRDLMYLGKSCFAAGLFGWTMTEYKMLGTIGPFKTKRYYVLNDRQN